MLVEGRAEFRGGLEPAAKMAENAANAVGSSHPDGLLRGGQESSASEETNHYFRCEFHREDSSGTVSHIRLDAT